MSFAAIGRMFRVNDSTIPYIYKNEKAIRFAFTASASLTEKGVSHNCFIPEAKQYLSAEVLLILDNATGHPENLKLQSDNEDAAFLFPNISSLIQPLNQALIRTFKAY
ncbi:Tigger transposable element-derived protein 1 [Trichinella patagoniensis]|uniref:Tigger transposable element-derived protein 1 n=1 Tax=Trichinella patagoniensis TaxID=990121 RepID=A0A0V1A4B4_9BILA|nr:Tigger transposable element-derived protein 1 [Trichinella patagoniensis]